MPLSPVPIAKSASNADAKIEAGRVVEYEQHSKALLGVALREKKGKWVILNQEGAELELPVARLYLLPGVCPDSAANSQSKAAFLQTLSERTAEKTQEVDLESVWQLLLEETREATVKEITGLLFPEDSLESHLAVRRVLLADSVFFKRKKFGFEPRPEHIVEELKKKAQVEAEKQAWREGFISACVSRLSNPEEPPPEDINLLEQLAALGKSAPEAKRLKELLDELLERTSLNIQGRLEDKAFKLLVRMKHFDPDENIVPLRLGRPVLFSEPEIEAAAALRNGPVPAVGELRKDLRSLTTVTIDGAETRDFDDALSFERLPNGCRVGIHISDVAALVPEDSTLENTAFRRATSIYCPDGQLPMLPPEVSEQMLSLIEGTERCTLSYFIDFDSSYKILTRSICRSLIHISKRITYEEADEMLCAKSSTQAQYHEILLGLWEASSATEAKRLEAGAVQFDRREMSASILPEGKVAIEQANEDTPARRLVSEMMILCNETAALFARDNSLPLVFRTQEPPEVDLAEQGLTVPEGPAREFLLRGLLKRSVIAFEASPHSGLGLEAYAQVTSPIRRAVDLINQRQIGAFLDEGSVRYTPLKLTEFLAELEVGLDEASIIQRERNRYWLLKYLIQEKIKEIAAVIVKVDGPRPLAELDILFALYPFHSLMRKGSAERASRKDLGRHVKLRIDSIDPRSQSLVLREIE